MNIIVSKAQLLFPYVHYVHLSDAQAVLLLNGQSNIGAQVQYLCGQALRNWHLHHEIIRIMMMIKFNQGKC